MKTLTWMTFLPLLTAGILILIPSRMKTIIKGLSVVGAFITFLIATGIVRDYINLQKPDSHDAIVAQIGDRAQTFDVAAARFLEQELAVLEDDLRGRVQALLDAKPLTGAGSALTAGEATGLGPRGALAYERAREIQLAATVDQAKVLRYVEFVPWIGQFKINYFMGVDGLSLPLIWLTALLGVLCLVYSWTIGKGTKVYFILFLILETGLIGVFCALDFFLFYVFWEIVLLPMYFLIGVWGGPNRLYAAIKFFIYTLVGSVLMLLAMLVMFFLAEPHTFNFLTLMKLGPAGFSSTAQIWLFMALFIGFAIKVPVFPFHTWLPDAHVEAPTAVSVVLAGVLLKMGGYGFFRVSYPMLPDAAVTPWIIWMVAILGMVNIVYGAFCAMAQKDFKKLVAYSSVSHMGYLLLGMAALSYTGVTGAVFQMFTHGLSSAMLFFIVGVIYDRAHHRDLDNFGGIGLQMPWYTGLATVGFFTSLGLPGLAGFISEALTFIGSWDTSMSLIPERWIIYVSLLGIVLTAVYILWTVKRVYLGTIQEKYKSFRDVSFREVVALAPLALLCVLVGVFPGWAILDHIDSSLKAITDMARTALAN